MMFTVSHDPLDLEALKSELPDPGAGACVIFEGWIRDTNYDKPVTALDYEVYEEMAVKEGNRVMAEAMEEYDILAARCAHVAGHLEVGDCAVQVPGFETPIAPNSNLIDFYIAHRLEIETVRQCVARGVEPPVWRSARWSNTSGIRM